MLSFRTTLLRRPLTRRLCTLEYASSCWLPTTWTPLPLLARVEQTHNTTLYDFGLPGSPAPSLSLPTCACLLLRAPGRGRKEGGGPADFDETDAVRPYTPVSEEGMPGRFQLLIKRYDDGAVSEYLHKLPIGSTVDFKHISFNVKEQYPFEGKKRITMLCGGTGIAPMYQALLKLMDPSDTREVTLVVGNKTEDDILMRAELEAFALQAPERFKLVYVLGDGPDGAAPSGWASTPAYTAASGWIDKAKVEEFCHPPADDTLVFVCGVPQMYTSLCGPRTEKELAQGSVLEQLGYTPSMVAKM